MKKIVLILLVLIVVTTSIKAQKTSDTFAEKDNVIGIGFGLGGAYGINYYESHSPVFGVQYDRGIIELGMGGVIGVGGFLGYTTFANRTEISNGEKYKEKLNVFIIGARGTFHYDLFKVKNLDTYGAAMIEFHAVGGTNNIPDAYDPYYDQKVPSSTLNASILAGAKYYFTPQIAAFLEVGYGVSWLTTGIAFKF